MKSKLILALILVALAGAGALAQMGGAGGIPGPENVSGCPRTIAAGTSTNLAGNIDLRFWRGASLELAFRLDTASTSNTVSATFGWSLDGTTYDSAKFVTISATSAGTNLVRTNTEFTVGGYLYLVAIAATNAGSAGTATNVSLRVATKP
jgi:hypothetical protein